MRIAPKMLLFGGVGILLSPCKPLYLQGSLFLPSHQKTVRISARKAHFALLEHYRQHWCSVPFPLVGQVVGALAILGKLPNVSARGHGVRAAGCEHTIRMPLTM